MSVYEARDTKRRRATRAEMEDRHDRIEQLAAEHGPCSVRHLFYRAVVDGITGIDKSNNGYMKVQRAVLHLRREGRIPYSTIVDNSRTAFTVDVWNGTDGFLADVAGVYRRDLWARSPYRVEVWCESDSIAGTLTRVTQRWRLPLFPIRGQSSETFAYNAAQSWTPDRLPVVLYVGDHDPAGLEIEESLKGKLVGFAVDAGIEWVSWLRVGVTWEQVEDLDLPGTRPKKDYGYPLSVEAEALPPRVLVDLLDDTISSYADADHLETLLAVEAEERDGLHRLAESFGGAA